MDTQTQMLAMVCARCLLNDAEGAAYPVQAAVTLVGGVALCREHGVSAMRNRARTEQPRRAGPSR